MAVVDPMWVMRVAVGDGVGPMWVMEGVVVVVVVRHQQLKKSGEDLGYL